MGKGFNYGSVCSGIEAATVAWHPLGWKPAFFSEIEAFPRAVLTHHYPQVPLHGDFTTIQDGQYDPIDLLVGGTPCQSFSVAGLRGGLDDERGNLALEYLRLAQRLRPRWLVWENVPGVLSSNGGRDFGAILGGMVELGYGVAYRVLDAQFFGVAQRRRRVFVVGYFGDWRRAAAVLFERHGLSGYPAPRREEGKDLAPTISARPSGGGGLGTDFDLDGGCVVTASTLRAGGNKTGGDRPYGTDVDTCDGLVITPFDTTQITSAANYSNPQPGAPCHPLASGAHAPAIAYTQPYVLMERGRDGSPNLEYRQDGTANAILTPNGGRGGLGVGAVAYPISTNALRGDTEAKTPSPDAEGRVRLRDPGFGVGDAWSPADTLQAAGPGAVGTGSAVRRLTPTECERLQGFPDGYTLIPWRGKPADQCPDGPRYKGLGNSMAVPCMSWIGRRIAAVEALQINQAAA